jgi:hypothetical protein
MMTASWLASLKSNHLQYKPAKMGQQQLKKLFEMWIEYFCLLNIQKLLFEKIATHNLHKMTLMVGQSEK